jgi:p-aminobenzoyl-glutamate transporter AbgT
MEKQNDSLRDRLLARLPQPENLASYREESATLLAKHEKALFWEKVPAVLIIWIGVAFFIIATSKWSPKQLGDGHISPLTMSLFFIFVGYMVELRYRIYRSKVDLLKEIKQLQLQVLEVQATLEK